MYLWKLTFQQPLKQSHKQSGQLCPWLRPRWHICPTTRRRNGSTELRSSYINDCTHWMVIKV